MAKFRNENGVTFETNDAATINNYRNRPGFTEVKPRAKSSDSGSDSSKTTDKK